MTGPSALHEAARTWAQAGFFVFPCRMHDKKPAIEAWEKVATSDLARIDKWWTENPAYNIGVVPALSDMFVLDQDGPVGANTLARLTKEHGALPETLTIRTPSGPSNLHYWFVGECPNSVGTLGEKIDTRGKSEPNRLGYVLVPPSYVVDTEKGIDGGYEYAGDEDEIAAGPTWIADTLLVRRESVAVADARIELDQTGNIARAKQLLKDCVANGHIAIEGAGGDNRTYAVAAEVLNMGTSTAKAFELLREEWNPHCEPPWSEDDLATKVANAHEYAQNEAGAWAVPDAAELFKHIKAEDQSGAQTSSVKRFKHGFTREQSRTKPPPSWAVEGVIERDSDAMLFAQSSVLKSFVSLEIAGCIAYGLPVFGNVRVFGEPGPVFYCAAEGARDFEKRRITAWEIAHGIDPYKGSRIFMADHGPLLGMPSMAVEFVEDAREFLKDCPGERFRLFVIDTYHTILNGNNEDAASTPGLHFDMLRFVRQELGCATLTVHHTGKNPEREERGSYALRAGMDAVLKVPERAQDKTTGIHSLTLLVDKQRNGERGLQIHLQSRKVETPDGPSLVLARVSDEEISRRRVVTEGRPSDRYSRAAIGAALQSLDAHGEARIKATPVLALELVRQWGELSRDPEAQKAKARAVAARLGERAKKGVYDGYLLMAGNEPVTPLQWFLPKGEDDEY